MVQWPDEYTRTLRDNDYDQWIEEYLEIEDAKELDALRQQEEEEQRGNSSS